MDFLQLVNDCIDESKQVLDHLTSANFASPPRTVLYNRLKNWVAQSYVDLLEERREWFFSNERGVVTIQPRLHVANVDPSYIPEVGDVITGDQSGVTFTITEVFSDNEGQDDTDEYTLGVDYDDDVDKNTLIQWETFSAVSGLDEFESVGRIENRGRYNLAQYIPTIDHIDLNSFTIKDSVLDPEGQWNSSTAMPPLRYIPWPEYVKSYDNFYSTLGHPTFVAKASNGDLQFYPYPDGLYDVTFDYEQTAPILSEWDDTPALLPTKHHKLLVWKALIELADFNNDRALFARANKKYNERLGWLMRDYLPEITLDTQRFYRGL